MVEREMKACDSGQVAATSRGGRSECGFALAVSFLCLLQIGQVWAVSERPSISTDPSDTLPSGEANSDRCKVAPSKASLDAISDRGRRLADYFRAQEEAMNAVQDAGLNTEEVARFVGRKGERGWTFIFGRAGKGDGPFLTLIEAIQTSADSLFEARLLESPREESGRLADLARALETAVRAFGPKEIAYGVAPLEDGQDGIWAYLYPLQRIVGAFPLGADTRYRLTSDGRKILETRTLHKTILEVEPPAEGEVKFFTHIAIMDCLPEDTDVFAVLCRVPSVPELIMAEPFVYIISPGGEIHYMGTRESFLKGAEEKGGKRKR